MTSLRMLPTMLALSLALVACGADNDETADKTPTPEAHDELAGLLQRVSMEAKDGNANVNISEALKGVGL